MFYSSEYCSLNRVQSPVSSMSGSEPGVELSVTLAVAWWKSKIGNSCVLLSNTAGLGLWGEEKAEMTLLIHEFSNLSMRLNNLEGLWKQKAGLTPRISGLVGLGWRLTFFISSKFPGDADAAQPGTTHSESLAQCVVGKWTAKAGCWGPAEGRMLFLERCLNKLCAGKGGIERGI